MWSLPFASARSASAFEGLRHAEITVFEGVRRSCLVISKPMPRLVLS